MESGSFSHLLLVSRHVLLLLLLGRLLRLHLLLGLSNG